MANLFALVTVEAGLDTLDLICRKMPVAGIIGLHPTAIKHADAVSGYVDIREFGKRHSTRCHLAHSYALDHPSDRCEIESLEIDVLAVLGWQRLVPDWLINHCRKAVLGCHGSAHGITKGRGRSPQNWALLLGHSSFEISLFRIDSGVDSGPVLATRAFHYGPCDDIAVSYQKHSWLLAEMITELLFSDAPDRFKGKQQVAGDARYLPQRTPADGEIDWHRNAVELSRFVSALSRPYPGAWTQIDNETTLRVWRAIPFSVPCNVSDYPPGHILARYANDSLVIRCGNDPEHNSLLLVQSWNVQPDFTSDLIQPGLDLHSTGFQAQMETIVQRHRKRFPNAPLHQDIIHHTPIADIEGQR